jgi:hypothetical protein
MNRLFPLILMTSMIAILAAGSASATTYYIAANGSDSNNGTAKTSPWLHAPGMSTCTGTCNSTTIKPGDSIILRGGDTWHFGNSSLTPFAGYTNNAWNFTFSGSSSTCNVNAAAGALNSTGCIYIGVDQTWYSGSSWSRPMFNMDNPLSTGSPSRCAYEDSNYVFLNFSGTYLIVDNFEILGWCWNTTAPYNNVASFSQNSEWKNSYFHGWTMGATATGCGSCDSDEYWALGGVSWPSYQRVDHNVFDGSDSTYGNLPPGGGNATGGMLLSGPEVDHNVFNHCSDGVKYASMILVHDNLFENMSEPAVGGTHGNVMEWAPSTYTSSVYYYNNIVEATVIGETIDFYPGSNSKHGYIFNNVMTGTNGNSANCYMLEGDASPGMTYFFNNTTDNPCVMRNPGRGSNNATFQNNHFIGSSPSGQIGDFLGGGVTATDKGNEIWQTESAANGQGYTPSNNYAPTSASGATVGQGANLTSMCSAMDNAAAASACEQGITGITYNTSSHTATDNSPNARPASGAWDSGAYEFASSGGAPAPPTGLTATVQ